MLMLIYLIVGVVVGGGIGYYLRQSLASKKIGSAEGRPEKILEDAKNKEKELLLEAKAKSIEIIEQAKKQEEEFRGQIMRFEERIDRREKELGEKSTSLDKQRQDLETKTAQISEIQEEIATLR